MPPDNAERRPPTRSGARTAKSSPRATIPRTAAGGRHRRGASRLAAVTARVSLLTPVGRRTRWWYLATRPVCGAPHLGRELADVTGTRRLPYGHWVAIVVARTYGRTSAGAAA
jgi:hypothetical protein